jgi:hypothetical protein
VERRRRDRAAEEIHYVRDTYSSVWRAYCEKKIKTTPWATSEGQMACKTVALRRAKVLPMSTDVQAFVQRVTSEDTDFSHGAAASTPQLAGGGRKSLTQRFDALAAGIAEQTRQAEKEPGRDQTPPQSDEATDHDPETGEVRESEERSDEKPQGQEAEQARGSGEATQELGQEPARPELVEGRGATPQGQEPKRGKITFESGKPRGAAKPGAAELLADLKRTAAEKIAQGLGELRHWLDNDLTAAEEAVIPPDMRVEWERAAKASAERA